MNENKRIDNPRIKIGKCVGVRAQSKKCVETIQNQEMGVSFNTQNSLLSNWSLPTEKIFQAHRQICLWQIFQLSIFVLAREKCHYQSHWIRNFRFKFSFRILVFFSFQENLNLLFWKRYGFSAAIIRKKFPTNDFELRMVKAFGRYYITGDEWGRKISEILVVRKNNRVVKPKC